ncbi:MAG TPA: RNA methyltransferase [Candidatus Krumholzibacteria bacterium]|jgi:23S rRNA (guanosine2251-2'-O)-methyltransferase
MLHGISPVEACLLARRRSIQELLLREKPSGRLLELRRLAEAGGIPCREISVHDLGNLSRSQQHQGVVLRCGELPTLELEDLLQLDPSLIVALDQIEDPQNLGGIARSAKYFGAGGLIILRAHSAPLSAAASKASAGTLESLPVARVGNLAQSLRRLRDRGYQIVGADLGDDTLPADRWDPAPRSVLVLGAEGTGMRRLSRDLCELRLHLVGGGGAESLNVSVAAGILMNIWRKHVGEGGA